MRIFLIAALAASMPMACVAQEPAQNAQPGTAAIQQQPPSASPDQMITIPAGTRIQLSLTSPITTRSKPGNTVRAVTGFPITVGTQLAIPVGTYLEGTIDKISRGGRSGPTVQIHFTKILYANGYSLPIDGNNTTAKVLNPEIGMPEPATVASLTNVSYALPQQQQPPPLQPAPSHIGTFIGIAVGTAVAAIVTIVLLGHHGGGSAVLFDSGWQFEMVLQSPLTVNAATVAAGSTPH